MATRDIYEFGFDEESGKQTPDGECPECKSELRADGGELSCTECGLIVNEYHLDHAARPLNFPGDERNPERTGAPLTETRHDRGLSTEMGYNRDGKGNQLSAKKRRHLGRLRREHSRAKWRSKAERNLGLAFSEVARIISALSLPHAVREDACALYREAQSQELIQGRSIEGIATASVYVALRRAGFPHTISDFESVARCDEQHLQTCYQVLNQELELTLAPRTPVDFIPRLASELDIPRQVEQHAQALARVAVEEEVTIGCHPAGVAGGCLAVALGEIEHSGKVRQTDLARVADVSPTTIRARRDALLSLSNDLPNKDSENVTPEWSG